MQSREGLAQKPDDIDEAFFDAVVPEALHGARLDKALAVLFAQFSRARLQVWMKENRIEHNGKPVGKSSVKVATGDVLHVKPGPLPHMQEAIPEDLGLQPHAVLPECYVMNKPAGLVVHPAPGNWSGTLMHGLCFMDDALKTVPRAGIVHRLDADTSGLMVVARDVKSQNQLIHMLQCRLVKRVYLAVVWGHVQRAVRVEARIGRDPRNRLRMAVVDFGKPAVTHFTPIALGRLRDVPVSLVLCRLETGRTHQIRVHAQHAGFALVADPVYKLRGAGLGSVMLQSVNTANTHDVNDSSRDVDDTAVMFNRQALHAAFLGFPNLADYSIPQVLHGQEPESNREMNWRNQLNDTPWHQYYAAPPKDLIELVQAAGIVMTQEALRCAVEAEAALHDVALFVPQEARSDALDADEMGDVDDLEDET